MQGDKHGGGRPSLIGEAAGSSAMQPHAPQRARVLDDLSGQTTGARASQRMRQAGVTLAVALAIALAWVGWQRQRAAPRALPLDEASMAGHAVIAANPSDALHGAAPAAAIASLADGKPAVAQEAAPAPARAGARIVDAQAAPRVATMATAETVPASARVAGAAAIGSANASSPAGSKTIVAKRATSHGSSKREVSRSAKAASKQKSRSSARAVARNGKSRAKVSRVATRPAKDPDSDLLAALLKRSDAPAR